MTLANGRTYLAIPGPSVMPDRVLQAMHRAAPNIYTGALVEMVEGMVPDLLAVARTEARVAMYIANGHGVWEAALANTVAPGQKVLVIATGMFAKGWAEMARGLGIDAEVLDFGDRSTFDPAVIEEALRADTTGAIRAVLAVQVDTATSVRSDIPALREVMDASGHPALLMVDCIACLACDDFHMDAWGVDVMVTGCQKGLMTPPGLGFVFFNEKANEAHDRLDIVSPYWDWAVRSNPEMFYQFFFGTAPTHHLYGLREALTMILHEEGLEAVLARHEKLAQTIWAAMEAWGKGKGRGHIALNVTDPALRSHAVTSVRMQAPNATALRDWVTDKAGVTLGIGLGMAAPGDPAWHGFFRIGHMGHVNAHMVLGVLGTIDAGLKALQIPHGDGALEAATAVAACA
ncbi:pyridoxal-phosphate-dependent aminotransferase family protein [Dinoroseobacter sp. S375]|uniref:pyridoxal-phosphate-dependent aminotransferase family protein n=1 Tax=Dinoroseobacter sp. S375 TaxID=3415136 RepID=UPI003C7D2D10